MHLTSFYNYRNVTYTDKESTTIPLGSLNNPASSCSDIPHDSPSGEYWIQTNSSTSPVQVYCDTNQRNCSCNTTGGWARVANLDMTDPTQQCPVGFKQINRTEPPLRTCGRPGVTAGCVSTTLPVYGINYSFVCGRILAYQLGSLDAFLGYNGRGQTTIDGYYIDGISLTHGQTPRQHIWTFVGALAEQQIDMYTCPCTKNSTFTLTVPPFIGNDYFCDTALRGSSFTNGLYYPDDPLWDGQGCGGTSTCCEFNNPPWFCKELSHPTTDNIELRICGGEGTGNEDAPIEKLQIYIK